jgi:hypothetical protein
MRRSTTATRPYRLYFRGAMTLPEQRRDAILASDEEARQLAMRMLGEQTAYPCVEVWDGARLVCAVRKGE